MIEGSTPTAAIDHAGERLLPERLAFSADITRSPAAPSETAEALPAVIVSVFGSNAGFRADSASRVVSGRMTSSESTRRSAPFSS
jgi:hypothetical protein